jgi:hypothetical protein
MSGAAADYAAPLSGWRTWRIDESGAEARLRSVVRATPWPAGEALVAECPVAPLSHPAPAPRCACGIYAARDVAEAAYHAELPSRAHSPLVAGLATLWGDVVEGEAGWRAAYAYPQTLYVLLRRASERERAADIAWDLTAYGVPVGVLDCTRRRVVTALWETTPAARLRRPVPLAA